MRERERGRRKQTETDGGGGGAREGERQQEKHNTRAARYSTNTDYLWQERASRPVLAVAVAESEHL